MLVLLAAKPGPMREGLDALLDSIPEVSLVAHATDVDAARSFYQRYPTQLMILEIRPGDRSLLAAVSELKSLSPQSQALVLIHEDGDRPAAEASGADSVLVTGTRASKLKEAVTQTVIASMDGASMNDGSMNE